LTKTTDAQISSIFQKLMINSRGDIVGFISPEQRSRVSAERSHIPRQSRDNHDPFILGCRADAEKPGLRYSTNSRRPDALGLVFDRFRRGLPCAWVVAVSAAVGTFRLLVRKSIIIRFRRVEIG
jgi:hypothetical protein